MQFTNWFFIKVSSPRIITVVMFTMTCNSALNHTLIYQKTLYYITLYFTMYKPSTSRFMQWVFTWLVFAGRRKAGQPFLTVGWFWRRQESGQQPSSSSQLLFCKYGLVPTCTSGLTLLSPASILQLDKYIYRPCKNNYQEFIILACATDHFC